MPERHGCPQRYTLQLSSVPSIEMTCITVQRLRQNGTSNTLNSRILTLPSISELLSGKF